MTNEEFIKSISLDGEEWRDVVGYEGQYAVSSYGRVVSLYRITQRSDGVISNRSGKLLSQGIASGYRFVCLCYPVKTYRVHRLVAEAFLPNPYNYSDVDHIDTNRDNNHVSNLRWCSRSRNMRNPITREKMISIYNSYKTPIVRISPDNEITFYESIKSASKDGFDEKYISKCTRGLKDKHKGYKWMRLSDYETLVSMSKNSTDSSAD